MLEDSIDMVFKQRSDFGYTKDPSETTHRISLAIGPPTRCARHDIILLDHIKDQCYNSWKYVPTIISDRDSALIGVRIPQTQDA